MPQHNNSTFGTHACADTPLSISVWVCKNSIFFSPINPTNIRFRQGPIYVRMENIRLWQNLILENRIEASMLFEEANSNRCRRRRRCCSPLSPTRATTGFAPVRLDSTGSRVCRVKKPGPARFIYLSIKSYFPSAPTRSLELAFFRSSSIRTVCCLLRRRVQ